MIKPHFLLIPLVTLASGVFASPAAAASGGTAEINFETRVQFTAGKGQADKVVVTRSGRTVTIDGRYAIKAGRGCKKVKGDKTKVRCTPASNPTSVLVYLRDKNDTFVNRTGISSSVYGGSGNDVITGGSGHDGLIGETGSDKVYGGAGNDFLIGDAMKRPNRRGSGADVLRGGPGRDEVSYSGAVAVRVDLDGRSRDDGAPGEHDTVGSDVEDLNGSDRDDVLTGDGRANYLSGGEGDDRLFGAGGNDTLVGYFGSDHLFGQAGNDLLLGVDAYSPESQVDFVDGGSNPTASGDRCNVGVIDIYTGCERMHR